MGSVLPTGAYEVIGSLLAPKMGFGCSPGNNPGRCVARGYIKAVVILCLRVGPGPVRE
jgi:hypothetical protein